jgi:hypothetical protein
MERLLGKTANVLCEVEVGRGLLHDVSKIIASYGCI